MMQGPLKVYMAYCLQCDWGSVSQHQATLELRALKHLERPGESVKVAHPVAFSVETLVIQGLMTLAERT